MASNPTGATMPGGDDVDRTIPMPPGADATLATDPEVGEGYRVGSLLGRGGEGEVHAAVQLAFGRSVAIKTLRSGSPEPRLVKRFRAEAAVTALLEHPNIIPVHDLRLDAVGRLQLVMKQVSGRTWRDILDANELGIDEHIAIMLKVCDAIEFAHGRGIVHRDLKPENVMVGAHGEVLVMDWGCAAHLGPEPPHPDIPLLTELGGVSGTPAYISPEQARGQHAACGTWSDVHLLGATLYRILTGSPPRQGGDVRALIASAARGEPPQDPGSRAHRRLSAELTAIAMAALQPDPAQRTRTIVEFAGALRRYLEHREVLELVAEARRQHELAREGGAGADDAFRRAISAVEQANRLWPELVSARRLLAVVNLDAARHAYAAGALRQAGRLAQAAAAAAERAKDADSAAAAAKVSANAAAREEQLRLRERKHQQLRKLALGTGVTAGICLAIGLLLVWRESVRTATALERAEAERARRVEGERLAAPALLAQARELAAQRQFAKGLPLVDAAIGFAGDDPDAPLLRAELLIALGRRGDAVAALDQAIALRPDAQAAELRQLCANPPGDADARIAETLVRMGAGAAAGALNLAADQRADLAAAQLRKHWPSLPPACIKSLPDGTLQLRLLAVDLRCDSLEPLRGLPISSLDITNQDRVRDLAPLATLPLNTLTARNTGVRDFTPLKGLPLHRLQLGWSDTPFDLACVAGAPLEQLEAPGVGTSDLTPLAGMPLRDLRLYGCNQLADISALRDAPLEGLCLDAPKTGSSTLRDLSPLRGRPLAELLLSWQRGVTDLAPLRGMPLRRVVLNGTGVTDAAAIAGPALRNLAIGDTAITDIRPFLKLPLETLDLSPQLVRQGLDEMTRHPTLRQINSLRPADFQAWLAVSRRLAEANPDYPWSGRPTFADGRLIEIRFVSQVRSLAPLAALADLRVLHLSAAQVVDVQPLAGLKLTELVFTPARGAAGLDALRRMPSLQRIGSSTQTLRPAAEFWRILDEGR